MSRPHHLDPKPRLCLQGIGRFARLPDKFKVLGLRYIETYLESMRNKYERNIFKKKMNKSKLKIWNIRH